MLVLVKENGVAFAAVSGFVFSAAAGGAGLENAANGLPDDATDGVADVAAVVGLLKEKTGALTSFGSYCVESIVSLVTYSGVKHYLLVDRMNFCQMQSLKQG